MDGEFEVGTEVIYPFHGVARIVARETRQLNGVSETYLRLFVPQTGRLEGAGLTLSVPENRAADVGIRMPVSVDEADDVLEVLEQTDISVPASWSRRFKNHQEKLKSGDIYHCAEVVRNLVRRQAIKALAPAETQMYERARNTLVGELAVSWGVDHEAADARVDQALHS